MFITNLTLKSLLEKYKPVYALRYLSALTNWDSETYMPHKGIDARSKVLGITEQVIQQQILDPGLINDFKQLTTEYDKLNDIEKNVWQILNRSITKYQKLPSNFVDEYTALVSKSASIWAQARQDNDYPTFKPYLEKVFTYTKRMADYIGYENHPYEALVGDYEPGMTMKDFDQYFTQLKTILSKFDLSKVKDQADLNMPFDQDKLRDITLFILNYFSNDPDSLRLDESAHPFTNSVAINDVRITTNYHKASPLSAIYSTIHEFGHGLFARQTSPELEFTPLFTDISYGIHESQSRFWENIVGRRAEFLKILLPEIHKLGPEYQELTTDKVYNAANEVTPGLIRIEADELTYHYHILIRYEVEKALLDGKINFDQAPDYWDSLYEQYLGIKADKIANGIMQDIHWSLGYIGYFPTYSLGTILAAAIAQKLEQDLGNLADLIITKEGILTIQNWLKVNIHQYGGGYTYTQIFTKLNGKGLDLKPWEEYISNKFSYLLKD
jgi:carboxypeptidase Taq